MTTVIEIAVLVLGAACVAVGFTIVVWGVSELWRGHRRKGMQ